MDLVLVPVHLGMHWCLAVRSHFTFSPPGIKTGGATFIQTLRYGGPVLKKNFYLKYFAK